MFNLLDSLWSHFICNIRNVSCEIIFSLKLQLKSTNPFKSKNGIFHDDLDNLSLVDHIVFPSIFSFILALCISSPDLLLSSGFS